MALAKTNGSVTALSATSNSDTIALADGVVAAVMSVIHVNGTGTITAGAQVQPQISHDGTNWDNDGGAFVFGRTASATEYRTYTPPTDGMAVKNVRFAYTAPTGSTGHSLNARWTKQTHS